jgi:hypothetical protein
VATFAVPPKRTNVYVVFLVARIAIRCQGDLCDVLGDMAGVAIDAAVCPGQQVARLFVVIEAPSRPTIRIVTERTIRS